MQLLNVFVCVKWCIFWCFWQKASGAWCHIFPKTCVAEVKQLLNVALSGISCFKMHLRVLFSWSGLLEHPVCCSLVAENWHSCNIGRQQSQVTCCVLSVQGFRASWAEAPWTLRATGESSTPQTPWSLARIWESMMAFHRWSERGVKQDYVKTCRLVSLSVT